MARIEKASGERVHTTTRNSVFPDAWGTPPADEIERISWIALHTRARPLLPACEIRQPTRRPSTPGRITPMQARLELLRLRAKDRLPD